MNILPYNDFLHYKLVAQNLLRTQMLDIFDLPYIQKCCHVIFEFKKEMQSLSRCNQFQVTLIRNAVFTLF